MSHFHCIIARDFIYVIPEWSSGFPSFLQFKSEFGNKEFMIWATVSSWSCFCWLDRVSPSSAAKNIISLISVLTIWWCPCVESSPVLLKEGVCCDQCVLLAKLLAFALLHFVLQGQTGCYSGISWLHTFAFHSPVLKRTSFFHVSSRRSCRSSKNCSTSASSTLVIGAQTWITVILNGLPQKWTEVIMLFLKLFPSMAFWTLLDYEGYSISSKGFLPIVVDIMVIWVKFIHSSPF